MANDKEYENGNENGQNPPSPQSKTENNETIENPVFVTITQAELDAVNQEAAEYKDKYLRQLAETDNMRKRLQKERQELIQYAMQNVIAEFLNPIDHMENALGYTGQMSDEVKNWALGFQMILSQFKDVLNGHGVTPFTSVGTRFDPHLHEAIEAVETKEHPPGTVVSESIKGYKMGNRTIRPARVVVAKAPEETKPNNQNNSNHSKE